MKTIPYSKFKHGQRVTCEIERQKINDAKISIDPSGMVFICQNKKSGGIADDLLGYEYSWTILDKNEEFYDGQEDVENLQFLPHTLDDIEEGDVLVDVAGEGYEKIVLGVCGKVFFLSETFSHGSLDTGYTLEDLKRYGWTLKQEHPEQEITELTLEDVAKLANIPVEKLRIKD